MINVYQIIKRKVLYKFLEPYYVQGSNPLGPTDMRLYLTIWISWFFHQKRS